MDAQYKKRFRASSNVQAPVLSRPSVVRHSGECRNPGGHEWKKVHHSAIRYGRRDFLNPGFSHRLWIPAQGRNDGNGIPPCPENQPPLEQEIL